MEHHSAELDALARARLAAGSAPEIVQADLLADGHDPDSVDLALASARRHHALRSGLVSIAGAIALAAGAAGLIAAFGRPGPGSIAMFVFAAIALLRGLYQLLRGALTPMRLSARPSPLRRHGGAGVEATEVDWLLATLEVEHRKRRRLLMVITIVFALLVITIPLALLLILTQRRQARDFARLSELLRSGRESVLWAYGKVNRSPLATFSFVCIGHVDDAGRRRLMELPISEGELERALAILTERYPDAELGFGREQRRMFKRRAQELRRKSA